jgi:hypothetical protein
MLIIQVTIWLDHNIRLHRTVEVHSVREVAPIIQKEYGAKKFKIKKVEERQ